MRIGESREEGAAEGFELWERDLIVRGVGGELCPIKRCPTPAELFSLSASRSKESTWSCRRVGRSRRSAQSSGSVGFGFGEGRRDRENVNSLNVLRGMQYGGTDQEVVESEDGGRVLLSRSRAPKRLERFFGLIAPQNSAPNTGSPTPPLSITPRFLLRDYRSSTIKVDRPANYPRTYKPSRESANSNRSGGQSLTNRARSGGKFFHLSSIARKTPCGR